MRFLVFLLSLAIAFAPILIFFIVAKLMIQFMKNQKEYKKAQGYKDASFMNSRNKNSRTSRNKKKLCFDELKNFIEDNKDKLEKNFEKLENKKEEEPVVFDKDFQTHVSNYYKELRDKGYSKKEAYKMIKDSKDKAKGKKTEFEKFIKKEMACNKKEEIEKKDKSIIELLDNDLVKECESDHVDYHDENSDREFLAFDEEDFVKYQIYKEIFDKPLSIR
ncbi:hypothetical protein KQI68_08895 [Peptoniphilus sp. MSJ-1]|uniref:Uncharacterized protein n=1 Tax=Peptoniphilus ovalis TaxID=2841503 RepID=A0ABS6FIE7_9FIRM|nr:hypothetical protein [Peptoniphilus ovalis]MBU5669950.1 hypothetical protein [Peptoniphilus ovalis]